MLIGAGRRPPAGRVSTRTRLVGPRFASASIIACRAPDGKPLVCGQTRSAAPLLSTRAPFGSHSARRPTRRAAPRLKLNQIPLLGTSHCSALLCSVEPEPESELSAVLYCSSYLEMSTRLLATLCFASIASCCWSRTLLYSTLHLLILVLTTRHARALAICTVCKCD